MFRHLHSLTFVCALGASLLVACELPEPITGRACLDDRDCEGAERQHHCATDVPVGMPQVCVPGPRALPAAQNRPPVIGTNVTVVPAGQTVTASLRITDPDDDALTITLNSPGVGLTGLLVSDGMDFTYTADATVSGVVTDRFRMTVSDGTHDLEFNLLLVVVGQTDGESFSTWTGAQSSDPAVPGNWDPTDHVPDGAVDILVPQAANPVVGAAPLTVARVLTTEGSGLSAPELFVRGDAAFAAGRINATVVLPDEGPRVDLAGQLRELVIRRDAVVVSPVHVSVGLQHDGGALGIIQGTTLEVDGDLGQGPGASDIEFWPDGGEDRLFAPPTLIVAGRLSLSANISGVAGRVMIGEGLDAPALQPTSDIEFAFVEHDGETEVDVPALQGAFLRASTIDEGAAVRFLSSAEILGDVALHGSIAVVQSAEVRVRGTLYVYAAHEVVSSGSIIADHCVSSDFVAVPGHIQCLGMDSPIPPTPDSGTPDAPDAGVTGAPDAGDAEDAGVVWTDPDAGRDAGWIATPDAGPWSTPDAGAPDAMAIDEPDAAVLDDPDAGIIVQVPSNDAGIGPVVIGDNPDGKIEEAPGQIALCAGPGLSPIRNNSVVTRWGTAEVAGQLALDPGFSIVPGTYPVIGAGGGSVVLEADGSFTTDQLEQAGRGAALVDVADSEGVTQSHCVAVHRAAQLSYTTSGNGSSWGSDSSWNEFGAPDVGDNAVVSHNMSLSWIPSVNRLWVEPTGAISGGWGTKLYVGDAAFASPHIDVPVEAVLAGIALAGEFRSVRVKHSAVLAANVTITDSLTFDADLTGCAGLKLGFGRLTVDGDLDVAQPALSTESAAGSILELSMIGPSGQLDIDGNFTAGNIVGQMQTATLTVEGSITANFDYESPHIILDGPAQAADADPAQIIDINKATSLSAVGGSVMWASSMGAEELTLGVTVWPGAPVTAAQVTLLPGFQSLMDDGNICWTQSCTNLSGVEDACEDLCDD